MATFFANYPPKGVGTASVQTVQGEGTAGTPVGGLLTIQGDPSGTPIPISGSITANNASVGVTGAAVPADATYLGINSSGNLLGATGSSTGINVVVNAAIPAGGNTIGAVTQASGPWTVTGSGTAGTAASGVVTIQGIASMTAVKVDPSGGTGAVNVSQFGGNNVVTGTGTGGNGIPRVTVSSDSSLASVTTVSTVTAVTTVSTVTAVTAITNALPAGSNIIGNMRIDQTTPGTTNGVQAVSGTACAWQAEGSIAFGSITNAYQTIFTPVAVTKILYMRNNTNAAISVSMDAGTTLNFVLDAGDQVATDLVTNGLKCTTTAIQIKYTVGAPTSGSFRVNGVS